MKKFGTFAVSAIFMTAVAAAEPHSGPFRIELSNGSQVIALDAPIRRGTVVTFHDASGGALTGVPAEMVVRIVKDGQKSRGAAALTRSRPLAGVREDVVTVRPAAGLEPGEVLVIGPTGDGIASPMAGAVSAPNGNTNSNASSGIGTGAGAYGGAVNPNAINPNVSINPNQTLVGTDGLARVPSSTDLLRAQAAQTTVGPNGFPVNTNGAATVIGPNGTPTLAPGVPGSGTQAIGPNGTPVFSSGTTPTVIGPNGTPVQFGSPTTAEPMIGPNGTPELAQPAQPGSVQPGQPGSAQPVIGPNGTPVLAQPGQPGSVQPGQPGSAQPVIGPNGTPVTAPPGQPGGPAAGPGTGPGSTGGGGS